MEQKKEKLIKLYIKADNELQELLSKKKEIDSDHHDLFVKYEGSFLKDENVRKKFHEEKNIIEEKMIENEKNIKILSLVIEFLKQDLRHLSFNAIHTAYKNLDLFNQRVNKRNIDKFENEIKKILNIERVYICKYSSRINIEFLRGFQTEIYFYIDYLDWRENEKKFFRESPERELNSLHSFEKLSDYKKIAKQRIKQADAINKKLQQLKKEEQELTHYDYCVSISENLPYNFKIEFKTYY